MKNSNCLYCDQKINKYSLYTLFLEDDYLCLKCRNEMNLSIHHFYIEDLKVTRLYNYDSLFKTLLLQYKECCDEALAPIFLYKIEIIIRLKYLGYKILYVPSSVDKLNKRGFNHLKLIFEHLGFKEIKGLKKKEELCQANKNIIQREKMIDNFYYEGNKLDKVLIVDDVCTTGSSLKGVYKAIKNHCNHVEALVLASISRQVNNEKKGLSLIFRSDKINS